MLILCADIGLSGCASKGVPSNTSTSTIKDASASFPKDMYAAEFRAINLCDHKIVMKRCDGFQTWASPEAGNLVPNAPKESFFPPIAEFPTKTTIHWHDEQDGQDHEQAVDLTNVVPQGVDGVTVFAFSKDQKWTVRFEPKVSKSPD